MWKNTKLEYYQEHINPSCWLQYVKNEAPILPYICTSILLLYCRNLAWFRTHSHTWNRMRGLAWFTTTSPDMPSLWLTHYWDREHVAMQCPRYTHTWADFSSILGDHTQLIQVFSTTSPIVLEAFVTCLFTCGQELQETSRPPLSWEEAYYDFCISGPMGQFWPPKDVNIFYFSLSLSKIKKKEGPM